MDSIALILQRVKFKTLPISIRTRKRIEALQTAIEEKYPQECGEFPEIANGNLAYMLVLTEDIDFQFQGDEGEPLLMLQRFWEGYQSSNGAGLDGAVTWYLDTPDSVISAWIQHIDNQREIIKHALTPPELRSANEREALADPESPLVKPPTRSAKKSTDS